MILHDQMLGRTATPEMEACWVGMLRGGLVEVAEVVKNPCHHSSYHNPEAGTDQAYIRVRAKELLSDLGNQMKGHETVVWGPRIVDRMGAAKVRDWSEEVIVEMVSHRGRMQAKLQEIGEAGERRHGIFAEA